MKIIFITLILFLIINGCGNSSEPNSQTQRLSSFSTKEDDKPYKTDLAINYCGQDRNLFFEKINPSYYISNNSNIYSNKGHYNILVQTKSLSNKKIPIGKNCINLSNINSLEYTLYENNIKIPPQESKVKFALEPRVTDILLLLDFSGSIVDDCDNTIKPPKDNSCIQLVNSVENFIDYIIDNNNQRISIYYFNSKIEIMSLASLSKDKVILKEGIRKLLDKNFRINNLYGYNSTNLYGAVVEATKIACHWGDVCNYDIYKPAKNSFKNVAIVTFTDSKDLAHRVSKQYMIDFKNKHNMIYYYALGIIGSDGVDKETLEDIGSRVGKAYVYKNSVENLNEIFGEVAKDLDNLNNSFYKVSYCPATQKGDVDIKIDIKKTNKNNQTFYGEIKDIIKIEDNIDFRCDL